MSGPTRPAPWAAQDIARQAAHVLANAPRFAVDQPNAPVPAEPPSHFLRRAARRVAALPALGPAMGPLLALARKTGMVRQMDLLLGRGLRHAFRGGLHRLYRTRGVGYTLRGLALLLRLPRVVDQLLAGVAEAKAGTQVQLARQWQQMGSLHAEVLAGLQQRDRVIGAQRQMLEELKAEFSR